VPQVSSLASSTACSCSPHQFWLASPHQSGEALSFVLTLFIFEAPTRCRSPHPWLVSGSPHQIPNFGAGSRSPYQIFSNCLSWYKIFIPRKFLRKDSDHSWKLMHRSATSPFSTNSRGSSFSMSPRPEGQSILHAAIGTSYTQFTPPPSSSHHVLSSTATLSFSMSPALVGSQAAVSLSKLTPPSSSALKVLSVFHACVCVRIHRYVHIYIYTST